MTQRRSTTASRSAACTAFIEVCIRLGMFRLRRSRGQWRRARLRTAAVLSHRWAAALWEIHGGWRGPGRRHRTAQASAARHPGPPLPHAGLRRRDHPLSASRSRHPSARCSTWQICSTTAGSRGWWHLSRPRRAVRARPRQGRGPPRRHPVVRVTWRRLELEPAREAKRLRRLLRSGDEPRRGRESNPRWRSAARAQAPHPRAG